MYFFRYCCSLKQRCNGKSECGDGSDELLCTFEDCPDDGRIKFCYTSQRCIDAWVTLCQCTPGIMPVSSSHTIFRNKYLQVYNSILFHTIYQPTNPKIEKVFFSTCRIDETCCSDGSGCYTQSQKCDGIYQCKNGADEEICISSSASSSCFLI